MPVPFQGRKQAKPPVVLKSDAMKNASAAPLTRRSAVKAAASLGILSGATKAGLAAADAEGRLKQSVCKWCYRNMALEDLCAHAAGIGIVSVELLTEDQWPTFEKIRPDLRRGQRDLQHPRRHKPRRES